MQQLYVERQCFYYRFVSLLSPPARMMMPNPFPPWSAKQRKSCTLKMQGWRWNINVSRQRQFSNKAKKVVLKTRTNLCYDQELSCMHCCNSLASGNLTASYKIVTIDYKLHMRSRNLLWQREKPIRLYYPLVLYLIGHKVQSSNSLVSIYHHCPHYLCTLAKCFLLPLFHYKCRFRFRYTH